MDQSTDRSGGRQIIIFTHNSDSPSFRYRIAPAIPILEAKGFQCKIVRLASKAYFWRIYIMRAKIKDAAAIVLHKLKIPTIETRMICAWNSTTLFDVDDAIYLKQPKWVGHQRLRSKSRERSFDELCRSARITCVGNEILAQRARSAGARVEILPTGIDVENYSPSRVEDKQGATLAWVGLPANIRYLENIRPALSNIAKEFPNFRLRVISSEFPDWNDIPVEAVAWSAASEKLQLANADIGIMPLSDDPYSKGKCAFKLLQYMAAGLPSIASPVGANTSAIVHGSTGYLASSLEDWEQGIRQLLLDANLRKNFGAAGRLRVKQLFDQHMIATRLATHIVSPEQP